MKDNSRFLSRKYIVRNNTISSRFFFAPINTGYAINGEPTQQLIKFHDIRSGKNIGISYVGNVAIGDDFVTNNRTLYFNNEDERWIELAKSISRNGSIPGIQLGCRYSKIQPIKDWNSYDMEKYVREAKVELGEIPREQINVIEEMYVYSALKAFRFGFRAIQIHAAHGYLLSLLLSNNFNKREDEYGNDKTLVLENIVRRIREKLPEVILDIRISLLEGLNTMELEIKDKEEIIERLCKLDIDIISISNGIYNINKEFIYPPKEWGHGVYINTILPFAEKYFNKLWNIAGNIWDLNRITPHIPDNITFSIGRAIIADPEFVLKTMEGNNNLIKQCIRCNSCHYYSLGKSHIECSISLD